MPRTKFYFVDRHITRRDPLAKHLLCHEHQCLVRIAEQMDLKFMVSYPDERITDLCISVPDEKLTPFLDALQLGGYEIDRTPVCDNDVQKLAIEQYAGLEAMIDPTPLEEWEMDELELLRHSRRKAFLSVLDDHGFEESDVEDCGGDRYLAILDGEYSHAGGFREVRSYGYFTAACQRYYEIVDEHGDDGEWHLYDCDEGGREIEHSSCVVIHLHGLCFVPRQ